MPLPACLYPGACERQVGPFRLAISHHLIVQEEEKKASDQIIPVTPSKPYKPLPFLRPVVAKPRLAYCCACGTYVGFLVLLMVLIVTVGDTFFPFSSEV